MIPCLSQATTLNSPFEEDVPAYARSGWTAVEIWLTKLETYLERHAIGEARALLEEHGLRPLAAAGQGGLLISTGPAREAAWELFRRRVELLGALGVPTLVLTADVGGQARPDDYGRAVASLGEAAELAGRSGVGLALEFSKFSPFCASLDTAIALAAQCDAPNLGICLDLFHYYTGPSKFEDLAYLSAENLAWVQVCDLSGAPREVAADADRILPGEGDFQIGGILEHLARIGYDRGVSVEVLNPLLWRTPVDHLADAARRSAARILSSSPPRPRSGGA